MSRVDAAPSECRSCGQSVAPLAGSGVAVHGGRGLCKTCYSRARQASSLPDHLPHPPAKSEDQSAAEGTWRRGCMLGPPLSLPYRALARTCLTCGDLVTTPDDRLRKDAPRPPRCRECRNQYAREVGDPWRRANPEYRAGQQARIAAHVRQMQADTRGQADHHREPWTGAELDVAARADLTTREVAVSLGRTFAAVQNIRRALRADPRYANFGQAYSA